MKGNVLIGLTGPSGAGKTRIGNILKRHGYAVINADVIAREVTNHDPLTKEKLLSAFGEEIFYKDGNLNRRKLGDIAFSSKENTNKLNQATLPQIVKTIDELSKKHYEQGEFLLFLDAPTLFESGLDQQCYAVIAVVAECDVRKERIQQREPDLTTQQIAMRLRAQKPERFYVERSDYVIRNNHSIQVLEEEVEDVLQRILATTSEMR